VCVCALAAACGGDDGGGGGTGGFTPITNGPSITNPTHVWAFAPDDVWILDGTPAVQRFDGSAWTAFPTPSTTGLSCIYALSASDVWLCNDTQVLHYDGATFTMTDVTTPTGLDGLTALWASSTSDVFVVGNDAIVAHYNGATWGRTIVGSPNKTSIWGSGPTDVYTMSVFELSHYDGATWTEVTLDGGATGDGQVWGTSASDVWVMPSSTQISHYDGSAWVTTDLNIVGELGVVWGPATNDLWAAGTAGAIAHFNGSTWTEVGSQKIGSPYLQQLTGIHGTSSTDLWIVGHQLGQGGSTPLIYHRGG
jgi:hypothetical protein